MGNSMGKTANKRHRHNKTMRRGGAKGAKLTKGQIEDIIKFEKTNKYHDRSEEDFEKMAKELAKMHFDIPVGQDKNVWLRKNITTYQIAHGRQKK
jgi:hypothetical protein